MADNWLIEGVVSAVASGSVPGVPVLGTPERDWELLDDVWHQVYTIPVTAPTVLNGFDRLYVALQAPDDAVDKATINNDGSVGYIIDDDPDEASKIVSLSEPEQKVELKWNPDEPIIRLKHPAPAQAEKWRIIVSAGSPTGKSANVSVVVDAGPPPDGPKGEEFAKKVENFDSVWEYVKSEATGRKSLAGFSTWLKPADDGRYIGCIIELNRSDDADPDAWYKLTGLETDEEQDHSLDQLPAEAIKFRIRCRSVGTDGTNSYYPGVTPEVVVDIQPPSIANPIGNATGFSVSATYLSADYYGKKTLRIVPNFTAPNDASVVSFEFWAKREDGVWYYLGDPTGSGIPNAAIIEHLPAVDFTWEFALVAQDVDSRNRDGEVDTTPPNWPTGTPTTSLLITVTTGKLDGTKIEGIDAAAFAAGLTATHIGGALPILPSGTYPAGTPFILTALSPPKMYRVNSAGSAWTAVTDGADIVARSIFGVSLVVGAVGTSELSATEILVGPGSGRCPRFVVRATDSTLLCLIGDDTSIPFSGLYARNVKIAPGVASTDKYIDADGTGIRIKGATFELALNNLATNIKNDAFTLFGLSLTGMTLVSTISPFAGTYLAGGVVGINSGANSGALLSTVSGPATLALTDSTGANRVVLAANSQIFYGSNSGSGPCVLIDNVPVVRSRFGTRPTDVAGLIALAVYHGQCV